MAHTMTPAMLAATQADIVRPVMFVEIDTPMQIVNLWTGYGNIIWNSKTWVGFGNTLGIGDVSEQNTVVATGTSITLSGISQAYIAMTLLNLQRYFPAKVWIGALDDMQQLINTPFQMLNGRIDRSDIMLSGDTATIRVNIESRLLAMRIAKLRRYTDLDQRIEHPNDAGFSFVDTIQDAAVEFHG